MVVASPTTTADTSPAANLAQTIDSVGTLRPAQVPDSAQTADSAQTVDIGQVEVITIDSSTVASATGEFEPDSPIIDVLTESPATSDNPKTPILTGITMMSMDVPISTAPDVHTGEPILPSDLQIPSPRLTQFLLLSQQGTSPQRTVKETDLPTNLVEGDFDMTMDTSPSASYAVDQPGPSVPNINITRNEIFALSNVLGRIPPSFLEGTSSQAVPEFSVSVIENPPIPPQEQLLTTETSLQETSHPYQEQLDHDLDEVPPFEPRDKDQGTPSRAACYASILS